MERPTGDTEEMQRRVAEDIKKSRIIEEGNTFEILKPAPKDKVDPMKLQQQQMDKLLKR